MDEDGQGSTNTRVVHHFFVHLSIPCKYPARMVDSGHRPRMMPFRTHEEHKNNHKQQTTGKQHTHHQQTYFLSPSPM
jgi:hypothetical protein